MRRNDGLKLTLDDGKTTIVEVKLNRFEAVKEGGNFVRAIFPGFERKDGSKSG